MKIVRVPKTPKGTTVVHLILSGGSRGRILAVLCVRGPMSGFTEQREYETVEQAEEAAIATAKQRSAVLLIVENRT